MSQACSHGECRVPDFSPASPFSLTYSLFTHLAHSPHSFLLPDQPPPIVKSPLTAAWACPPVGPPCWAHKLDP